MNFYEKYIDLMAVDATDQINKHLTNGWHIYEQGLTLIILRKSKGVTI